MNIASFLLGTVFMLLLGATSTVGAQDMDRLFLNPRERAMLDQMRNRKPEQPTAEEAPDEFAQMEFPDEEQEPAVTLDPLTINGYVSRSGGPTTFWINDQNSYQGNFAEFGVRTIDVSLDERGRVNVRQEDSEAPQRLKPGQHVGPETEGIVDNYERQQASSAIPASDDADKAEPEQASIPDLSPAPLPAALRNLIPKL
ncbi:MAG: hypothetical protein AAF384_04365 [Pseudomonadota bacterium]